MVLDARIQEQNHALLRKQESLTKVQQISHLGSWDWNIASDEWWWSDEIYRIFGFARQQFEASHAAFLSIIHPDDRANVEECVRLALENPTSCYGEQYRVVCPDGTERVVIERAEVVRNAVGEPVHMVGTVQDITALRSDGVSPEMLKMNKIISEDSMRRGIACIDAPASETGLKSHLL